MSERPLHAPGEVRALLQRHGLRPGRSFGQNFLVDANVLSAVTAAAEAGPQDTVLEVGPGLGVLTREVAARAGRVVAVELDRKLLPLLEETVGTLPNVDLVQGDALRFDFATLPQGSLLVANLPYNIATALIAQALESCVFRRLVVMVQKEVAERLAAQPGTAAYGSLSLLAAHYASVRLVRTVPPSSFFPPPEVTSAVVRLDVRPHARPRPGLFRLIRDGFRHRRKTLARNLQMAGYAREAVLAALESQGLDPRIRAEELGLEQFERLQRELA